MNCLCRRCSFDFALRVNAQFDRAYIKRGLYPLVAPDHVGDQRDNKDDHENQEDVTDVHDSLYASINDLLPERNQIIKNHAN